MLTMKQIEEFIIDDVRELPESEYGGYQYIDSLELIIARHMGYPRRKFGSRVGIARKEDSDKVRLIIQRMAAKGIIRISRSGAMFRYTGA